MPDKPVENNAYTIENMILAMRGQKVILDSDVARVYGVPTKRLNEQVRRNKARFPSDFVFQLNQIETTLLNRSQIATGSQKHRDPVLNHLSSQSTAPSWRPTFSIATKP